MNRPDSRRHPWHPQYDVTADGRRFLMVTVSEEEITGRQIMVVQNWREELTRLAAEN